MKKMYLESITRTYSNGGQHAEQLFAYNVTGEIRKHDKVPYYMDSDVPETHTSVKSEKFTLAGGNLMEAQTFEGQIAEYMARTASTNVAYVTKSEIAYIMDMTEFNIFLHMFTKLEAESAKNGGKMKIRARSESKAMLRWFEAQIA